MQHILIGVLKMARVTVEDCIDKVQDRFELVIVASQRAKELYNGSPALVNREDDKNTVISLREIEENKLNIESLKDEVLNGFKHNGIFAESDESNKELEFIENEIMGENVFQDETQELNNVSEEELNTVA